MMLEAALRLAERGWPVFPCAPGAKVPLYQSPHPKGSPERITCRGECGRMGHGVLDATTELDIITAWWTRTPRANVALATGAPGPDVVDFDTAHGKPGPDTFVKLRDAKLLRGALAVVTTPSGGWHLHFPGNPNRQGNGALARHGVDFRGAGGYVLVPPSVVNGNRYALSDHRESGHPVDFGAIRAFLSPPRRSLVTGTASGRADVGALVRWVREQSAGNRNNALHWAACRAVDSGAGGGVFDALLAAAVDTGLPAAEAERTIRSAQRGR